MKKLLSLSTYSLCSLLLLTGSLYGEDDFQQNENPQLVTEQDNSSQEGVEILAAGSKRFSKDEEVTIQEKRALKAAQAEQDLEENPLANRAKKLVPLNVASTAKRNLGDQKAERISHGIYYTTSHEGAIHTALSVTEYRERVKLNDGTIWSIASYDRWKLVDWLITDGILILPNRSFFCIYDYVLVNQRTGDYVDVNLSELEVLSWDPTYYGNRHWIISIDYFGNFITLEDGSLWDVSFDDDSILQRMFIGDVVTIGINDGWDSTFRPNILVHFNSLKYVRADCLN